MNTVYYIVLLLSIVILFMLMQCFEYGTTRAVFNTTRAGKRVSAFCDTIQADDRRFLLDPVLTRDGYLIGDLVCQESLSLKRKIVKDLFVTTFLTDCLSFPRDDNELTWLRDWIRVKCLSLQDPVVYAQTLNAEIKSIPDKPPSMTLFYRDRMDPRQYASIDGNEVIQKYRDIALIDPLDDSWFFAVNTNIEEFSVFENVRSIAFRVSMNYPQRDMRGYNNTSALVGYFCVDNTTSVVEVRAITTKYRLFRTVSNFTMNNIETESGICCVCLDSINKTSQGVFTLSCGHFDHEHCLNQWFDQSFSCPECRADDISVVYR